MKETILSIDVLRLDGDTQCRVGINEDTVADYADIIAESNGQWKLGALHVFHDGSDYWLADGFHRTLAASRMKRVSVPCIVHNGSATDARIFAMTANDHHGLRMTRADKRKCIEWLLDNGGKMTQAEIAEKAGVSYRTVKNVVAERKEEIANSPGSSEQKTEQKGQIALLDSSVKSAKDSEKDAVAKAKADASAAKKAQKEAEKVAKTALKAKEKAERDKAKAEEKAAKAQANEEAKAAKLAAMPTADRAKMLRNIIQQHLDRAARAVCDLHEIDPNRRLRDRAVQAIQEVTLW